MAKLYRLIPDSVITTIETNQISEVSEDLFYKLGYISQNDHDINYFAIQNGGKSWAKNTESGIFFFFSPWACLSNLWYLNNVYGREVARIFEYEVPDEIVNNSPQGYGYYDGYAYKEVKIPLSYINKNSVISEEIDSELKDRLIAISIKDAEESFEYLKESVTNNEFLRTKLENLKASILNDKIKNQYFNYGIMEKVNEKRLKNCGLFFKSDMITGKSMIVTDANRGTMVDFQCEPEEYAEQLAEFCEKSNGMFTFENLQETFDEEILNNYFKKR